MLAFINPTAPLRSGQSQHLRVPNSLSASKAFKSGNALLLNLGLHSLSARALESNLCKHSTKDPLEIYLRVHNNNK